jgi:hypothetical protein
MFLKDDMKNKHIIQRLDGDFGNNKKSKKITT